MVTRLHTIFKYDNKRAIQALAHNLLTEMPDDHTLGKMAAHIIYHKLVIIPVGWAPKLVYTLMPRKWQWSICKQLGCNMYNDGTVKSFFSKTIKHMVDGVDATDPNSAGGWCKEEFNKFLTILDDHGYDYDNEPWWLIMDIQEHAGLSLTHNASG